MPRPWIAIAATTLAMGCTPAARAPTAPKKHEAPDERFVFFTPST